MLWTFIFIILLTAIGILLVIRYKQEKEWLLEIAYLSRHDNQENFINNETIKPAKEILGVDPNLQNTRKNHLESEKKKEVYDSTVEKLQQVAPKRSKQLLSTFKKIDDKPENALSALPIFASMAIEEKFSEVEDISDSMIENLEMSEQVESIYAEGQSEPKKIPLFNAVFKEELKLQTTNTNQKNNNIDISYIDENNDFSIAKKSNENYSEITMAEATRSLQVSSLTQLVEKNIISNMDGIKQSKDQTAYKKLVELNKSNFKSALDFTKVPESKYEPEVITIDDPSVIRTRQRIIENSYQTTLSDTNNEEIHTQLKASLENGVIGEDEIRANLLRQRLIRRRKLSEGEHLKLKNKLDIIPEGEVFANLERTDSPINRQRIRRVNLTTRESVIPDVARVEQAHAVRLQSTKVIPPISTRFTPYHSVINNEDIPAKDLISSSQSKVDIDSILAIPSESVTFHTPEISTTVMTNQHNHTFDNEDNRWFTDDTKSVINTEVQNQDQPIEEIEPKVIINSFEQLIEASVNQDQTVLVDAHSNNNQNIIKQNEIYSTIDNDISLPNIGLLKPSQFDPTATQTEEELFENSITIEEKLAEFKVKVKVLDAISGPVITRYEIEPDVGVRGNAVINLEKDLARSLGVASIRVVETIPGKTCMGLELPNPRRQMIRLSEILSAPIFQDSSSKLTLALGHDITGQPVITDLAKAPHLLVAGTTGSGKSVGVNAMILSMLFKATPEEVRMIMIDPKMLELSVYEGIPHLLAPVVTDMKLAANALNWCVNEMEKRYRLLSYMGVRNLSGFNQKIEEAQAHGKKIANPFSLTPDNPDILEKLPFIVVVVDEFADLMMTAGKKIEELIARLAQKARAAGIHLILATQRPSVDVITGLIKANIPTRIAFQVSSRVDSRTILDQMGAENLLGQGDMLYLPPGTGYPQRVHGAFASDEEVHGVVEFLKQHGEPNYIDDILTAGVSGDDLFSNANNSRSNDADQDPMYDDAVACVLKNGKASISSVQRYLRIGYNRAARLVDQMEAEGIVSPPENNGNRTILVPTSNHLD